MPKGIGYGKKSDKTGGRKGKKQRAEDAKKIQERRKVEEEMGLRRGRKKKKK